MNDRPVTLADVATAAGVSIATASRVLSSSRPVGADVAHRVRAAADRLGYSGNTIARALRSRRTDAVGMVVPSILNPFFTTLVDGLERSLHAVGKQLLLCDSRQDPEVEAAHLRSLVERHVDGIVVSPCDEVRSVDAVARTAARVPLVQLDRRVDAVDADWVGLDDDLAIGTVLRHLADCGARSFAFVASALTNSSALDRLRAFREHAAALGVAAPDEWIVLGEFSIASGEVAARRLLSGGRRPDALVCADDLLAIGVLRACGELGIAVPDEVQVTGMDDIEFARYMQPPLTTLAQPTARMADEVIRLLDLRADAVRGGSGAPGLGAARLALGAELIVRGSTMVPA